MNDYIELEEQFQPDPEEASVEEEVFLPEKEALELSFGISTVVKVWALTGLDLLEGVASPDEGVIVVEGAPTEIDNIEGGS